VGLLIKRVYLLNYVIKASMGLFIKLGFIY
jgi:hypothetical protein